MDKALALLLVRLIKEAYTFKAAQPGMVESAKAACQALGLNYVALVMGTDLKGLPGAETVPYGLVAADPASGQVYVGLRGTEDLDEWWEDAWAFPVPCPLRSYAPCRTHAGFTALYQSLVTIDGQRLADTLAGAHAIISGHSLGAALATLLAFELGLNCKELLTFEGPRVGDLAFVQAIDAVVGSHLRCVILGDDVPHAPPELMGYFHAGVEVDEPDDALQPLPLLLLERLAALHVIASVERVLEAAA